MILCLRKAAPLLGRVHGHQSSYLNSALIMIARLAEGAPGFFYALMISRFRWRSRQRNHKLKGL